MSLRKNVASNDAPAPKSSANEHDYETADGHLKSDGHFDFTWDDHDEPHASRRREMLKKYPEIRKLFGPEILTFPITVACVLGQILIARHVAMNDWSWGWITLVAYAIGGTVNHAMQLASHELSHNLCFRTPVYNQALAVFSNIATGMPSASMFKRYHMEHHQFQGVDGVDVDIPSQAEVDFFMNSKAKKLLWLLLNPFFYSLRPVVQRPKPVIRWDVYNFIVIAACDYLIFQTWGIKALLYLIIGTFLGLGLHPAAGHFIAEHYEFVKGYETYSYYGILNLVNFNVGYHNEHHDFPKVAWSKLYRLREIAPEYYNNLPQHSSYVKVLYDYIMEDYMGPFSRVKRKTTAGYRGD
jgi:sphingolipid 4-desaturase/C4-monooxygenase